MQIVLRMAKLAWTGGNSSMFTSRPIGFISSPYTVTGEVPKGLGAKHEAEGVLRILAEFEPGLTDIEGFSHLIVIWEFDRAGGFELLGTPPSDNRPHGVFATRSPRRPNPIGLTVVELRRHAAASSVHSSAPSERSASLRTRRSQGIDQHHPVRASWRSSVRASPAWSSTSAGASRISVSQLAEPTS